MLVRPRKSVLKTDKLLQGKKKLLPGKQLILFALTYLLNLFAVVRLKAEPQLVVELYSSIWDVPKTSPFLENVKLIFSI